MSAHTPLLPSKAIKLVEAAGLAEAQSILADYAAAGLIKTYALARVTIQTGQTAQTVRDAAIPAKIWQRIISDSKTVEALNGGTVRLAGSDLIGGEPDVQITGIRFSGVSLDNVLGRYCSKPKPIARSKVRETSTPTPTQQPKLDNGSKAGLEITPPKKLPPPIRAGDLLASVDQAMQALNIKRTKTNQLMTDGILVRKKIGGCTRITVESINRLLD